MAKSKAIQILYPPKDGAAIRLAPDIRQLRLQPNQPPRMPLIAKGISSTQRIRVMIEGTTKAGKQLKPQPMILAWYQNKWWALYHAAEGTYTITVFHGKKSCHAREKIKVTPREQARLAEDILVVWGDPDQSSAESGENVPTYGFDPWGYFQTGENRIFDAYMTNENDPTDVIYNDQFPGTLLFPGYWSLEFNGLTDQATYDLTVIPNTLVPYTLKGLVADDNA